MKRLPALVAVLGLGILLTQPLFLSAAAFSDVSAGNTVTEDTASSDNNITEPSSENMDELSSELETYSITTTSFGGWTLGDNMQEIVKLPNVVIDDALRKQLNTIFFGKPDSLDDISMQMLYTRTLGNADQNYVQTVGNTGKVLKLDADAITDFEGLRFLRVAISLNYSNGLNEYATTDNLFALASARAQLPPNGIGANIHSFTQILVTKKDTQYQYVEQGTSTYTYQPSLIPLMTDYDSRFDNTFPTICTTCPVASMRTLDLAKISDFPIINNNLVDAINYNTLTGTNVNPAGNTFAKYMYDENPDSSIIFRDQPLSFTYDSASGIVETTSDYFSFTERVGGFSAFATLTHAKIIFTGRVEVQYLDTAGNILAPSETTELPLQSSFTVPNAKAFDGYTLIKKPEATKITAGTQVLTFVYEKPSAAPAAEIENDTVSELPVTGENTLPYLLIGAGIAASGILLLKKRK
ncbi:LPXTG cell wall anchor domain-containing protein [Culicoidibacter larvae]|uniref:LPXTG cell wall anchor domain-containing protein n=1 Tax=Culicoidibacter larvae TaxID=2579976 RepID=A0A5R8QHJ1_9FIRM|nr:LPXTG cell wall anchor domain-containing protein [Culicoidibacter larvae]TLG77515.1 LPXTG cell wall anchor domain-containing protein [Culicoidibacter larvae]